MVHARGRFGRSKREAEGFVGSFVEVSITQRLRVMGDDVRLHKAYPGNWQARPLPHHCRLPRMAIPEEKPTCTEHGG